MGIVFSSGCWSFLWWTLLQPILIAGVWNCRGSVWGGIIGIQFLFHGIGSIAGGGVVMGGIRFLLQGLGMYTLQFCMAVILHGFDPGAHGKAGGWKFGPATIQIVVGWGTHPRRNTGTTRVGHMFWRMLAHMFICTGTLANSRALHVSKQGIPAMAMVSLLFPEATFPKRAPSLHPHYGEI